MKIFRDIDVVYNIGKKDFEENYLKPQKPVIIKGLLDKQPAGNLWNKEYFTSTMGNVLVDVYDNRTLNNGTAYTGGNYKMRFDAFLNEIAKDEHTDIRLFLFNLFKVNPKLKQEFPCPDIFKGILDHIGYTFFAGKDTKVRIHYDIDMSNVLHTQIYGRKRVVLISPEFNELMYCLPMSTFSLVDIDNPDYNKYPGLKYVKASECILERGDSIFIPSGYWHLMNYLTGGMGVAYRKMAYSTKAKLEGLHNLLIDMPVDKLFTSIAGKKWKELKTSIAENRANRILVDTKMM